MPVKIKDNLKAYIGVQKMNLQNGRKALADSILNLAVMKAPKLTGALRNDGRVESKGEVSTIVFGDADVPYARRRHFENKKNPQTLNYLKNAGDQIMKEDIRKRFKS